MDRPPVSEELEAAEAFIREKRAEFASEIAADLVAEFAGEPDEEVCDSCNGDRGTYETVSSADHVPGCTGRTCPVTCPVEVPQEIFVPCPKCDPETSHDDILPSVPAPF